MVLDRAVDWQVGDKIVLTSTDYLPGHAEQLTILAVSVSNGSTTLTTTAVAYPLQRHHLRHQFGSYRHRP